MKTSPTPPEEVKNDYKLIRDFFSDEELIAVLVTLLGACDLMARFLFDDVRAFIEIPISAKYAIVQHARFYKLIGQIVRGEIKAGEMTAEHLPFGGVSWKTGEDFEKRFTFVVETYYNALKKQGKVP